MARRTIEVPFVPKLIKNIEQILIDSGMTRRTMIQGDTIEAYGEVGIKKFYIRLDEVLDNKALLLFEAMNNQYLDIIINLVQNAIEDLNLHFQEEKDKNQKKDLPAVASVGPNCSICQTPLEELGVKEIAKDFRAKVFLCQKCTRLEFYKE